MTPPPVPAEAGDLMRVMAHAVVSVAARPAGRRGPWMFDEEALQTLASQCQSVLAAAPSTVSADHAGLVERVLQWARWLDNDLGTDRPAGEDLREAATALQQSAERIAGLERELVEARQTSEIAHNADQRAFLAANDRADKAEESNAHLFSIISDIREASGLGGKPMLAELADAIKATLAARDAEIERLTREGGDVFWDTLANGPVDGQPMAMEQFRAWAGIASKRIASANGRADSAESKLKVAVDALEKIGNSPQSDWKLLATHYEDIAREAIATIGETYA